MGIIKYTSSFLRRCCRTKHQEALTWMSQPLRKALWHTQSYLQHEPQLSPGLTNTSGFQRWWHMPTNFCSLGDMEMDPIWLRIWICQHVRNLVWTKRKLITVHHTALLFVNVLLFFNMGYTMLRYVVITHLRADRRDNGYQASQFAVTLDVIAWHCYLCMQMK